jgi:hypothetical protein
VISSKKERRKVAKKGQGMFGALTMKQTDKLARQLANGAKQLPDDEASTFTALEIYEVVDDLHDSWMARFAGDER